MQKTSQEVGQTSSQNPETKKELPGDYRRYTDKYFIRSRKILENEDINPDVSMKVFTRGEGKIAGLEEAQKVFEKYCSELEKKDGGLWVSEKEQFGDIGLEKEPLMVIEGKAQDLIELETMYLGVLSHELTKQHDDYSIPNPKEFQKEVDKTTDIYDEVDVPLIYFGARHYHWSMDEKLGEAALKGGAVQTSTNAGSSYIGEPGVGTTPHFLTIVLADEYGREDATLKTAEMFDRNIDPDVPRVTLIDTFNREITDSLKICDHFDDKYDDWKHGFRVDTPGENIAEGGEPYDPSAGPYETGTGVRIKAVKKLRDELIKEGYGENTELVLSSGFGNPEKARAFVEAHKDYSEETKERFGKEYDLFHSIGAGAFTDGVHCTSDIYAVNGNELAKTGRKVDLEEMEEFKKGYMEKVI